MKRDIIFEAIRPYFIKPDLDRLECAYNLAKLAHGYKSVQTREDGSRYIEHPKAVMMIIFTLFMIKTDWKLFVGSLIHDTREDVYLIIQSMIILMFGEDVGRTNMFVTKDKESKPIYFVRLLCCNDWRAIVIKLADRIHNLRTLDSCSKEKQRKQVQETRDNYFALCDYLETIIPSEFKHMPNIARVELHTLCEKYA